MPPTVPMVAPVIDDRAQVAIIYCNESFTLSSDHPLRETHCLICQQAIGDKPAGIIGAAALAGNPCRCGGIVSDAWLIHADHTPMPAAELHAAIRRGLECDAN